MVKFCKNCNSMANNKKGYVYICGKCGKDRRIKSIITAPVPKTKSKKELVKRLYVEDDITSKDIENNIIAKKLYEERKAIKEKYLIGMHRISKSDLDNEELLKYLLQIFDEQNNIQEMILLGETGMKRFVFS